MLDLNYTITVGAFIVALIIAIVVWTIVYIEYRRLKKQRKIDWLIKRIRERAEDSGNESDGDTEELSTMVDLGNLRLLDANNL
ncbi:vpu protein [Human immunodeficiency virus 1]|uniref:Protein Vpu n=1 Tax=Human immunodeficiency virus type 1 TaxID=11676 RepID=W8CZJ9_HV1|nr:vpu protein [Human immunodeficiency virus 1]